MRKFATFTKTKYFASYMARGNFVNVWKVWVAKEWMLMAWVSDGHVLMLWNLLLGAAVRPEALAVTETEAEIAIIHGNNQRKVQRKTIHSDGIKHAA